MREHGRPDFKADGQWIFCPFGDLTCLMQYGYLYPLRVKYPSIPVIPVFNQADGPETAALAGGLLEGMRESRGIAVGNLRSDPCVELFRPRPPQGCAAIGWGCHSRACRRMRPPQEEKLE